MFSNKLNWFHFPKCKKKKKKSNLNHNDPDQGKVFTLANFCCIPQDPSHSGYFPLNDTKCAEKERNAVFFWHFTSCIDLCQEAHELD